MMTGECSISKAGTKRIYAFGATTANHEVDYLAVIVYVDRYHEDTGEWGQIDAWMVEDANDYFVYTGKTITVDRGYYYRVHADILFRKVTIQWRKPSLLLMVSWFPKIEYRTQRPPLSLESSRCDVTLRSNF